MEVAQSYYSVIMRADFSVYEMRMLLHVVRRAHRLRAQGGRFKEMLDNAFIESKFNTVFRVSISEMMGGNSHNYIAFRNAMRKMLSSKSMVCEHYDADEKKWRIAKLFDNIEISEGEGLMTYTVPTWLVKYICDFSRGGYRVYNWEHAMSLSNPNAARLYLLTSSATKPITYTDIGALRAMLGVKESYPRISEFCRWVISPAAKELERKKLNGFTYKIVREFPKNPHSRVMGIQFIPVKREGKEQNISKQIESLKADIPEELREYLMHQFGCSVRELKGNAPKLAAFVKLAGWQDKFTAIVERTRRKRKNHGYLFRAIANEVAAATAAKSSAAAAPLSAS